MFSVNKFLGIELFGLRSKRDPRWTVLYPKLIKSIMEVALQHHYAQSSDFKKPYTRTTEQNNLMVELSFDGEAYDIISELENSIMLHVGKFIKADGHEYYGLYVVDVMETNQKYYELKYLGDYRILEWEQGRGRITPKDDLEEFAKAFDEGANAEWGIRATERPRILIISGNAPSLDQEIMMQTESIKARLAEDALVTDEEMRHLKDYDSEFLISSIREQEWAEQHYQTKMRMVKAIVDKHQAGEPLSKGDSKTLQGIERLYPGTCLLFGYQSF